MTHNSSNWLFKILDEAARRVDNWPAERKKNINYGPQDTTSKHIAKRKTK